MVDNTRIFGFEIQHIFQGSPVELNLAVWRGEPHHEQSFNNFPKRSS